jgi:phosphatidylethanolamine-binding protein (PEBP) family uncharacterized protein
MKLTSSAFTHEGKIPQQFTCEGQDISPDLSWKRNLLPWLFTIQMLPV